MNECMNERMDESNEIMNVYEIPSWYKNVWMDEEIKCMNP